MGAPRGVSRVDTATADCTFPRSAPPCTTSSCRVHQEACPRAPCPTATPLSFPTCQRGAVSNKRSTQPEHAGREHNNATDCDAPSSGFRLCFAPRLPFLRMHPIPQARQAAGSTSQLCESRSMHRPPQRSGRWALCSAPPHASSATLCYRRLPQCHTSRQAPLLNPSSGFMISCTFLCFLCIWSLYSDPTPHVDDNMAAWPSRKEERRSAG